MDEYFTYILRSLKTGIYYIGSTKNLNERIARHNSGRCKFTKNHIPLELVYYEKFPTRNEAYRRELYLKKLKNRKFIERLISFRARSSVGRAPAF